MLVYGARITSWTYRAVLYIGDSATDLLAIVAADVGVLIGESSSARLIARRYGLRIEPLPPAPADVINPPGVIWEVQDWEQVRECILGGRVHAAEAS